jgi:hypothetical protein
VKKDHEKTTNFIGVLCPCCYIKGDHETAAPQGSAAIVNKCAIQQAFWNFMISTLVLFNVSPK